MLVNLTFQLYMCITGCFGSTKKTTKISGTSETRSETPHGHSYVFLTVQPISSRGSRFIPLFTTHRDLRRRNYPATASTAWNRSQAKSQTTNLGFEMRKKKPVWQKWIAVAYFCFKSTYPPKKGRKQKTNVCVFGWWVFHPLIFAIKGSLTKPKQNGEHQLFFNMGTTPKYPWPFYMKID